MGSIPPSGFGGNYFNFPNPDKPIEALEDVNTILEVLHEAKSIAENEGYSSHAENMPPNMDLLKEKCEDLSKQLETLRNAYPSAHQYWSEKEAPPLSEQIKEISSSPLQEMRAEHLTEMCAKMQTLHDLLLF